jgi:DNA-binding transcriptional LysR family regulator
VTLNFIYFKYFCDAVKLGSVTAAAKVNFVTQSAVSQGIKKLEKSLECTLLAGHPNQLRITPEGYQAYLQMSQILKQTLEFKENLCSNSQNVIGDLELACTFSVALSIIPEIIKRFRTTYPQSKINLQCSGNPEEIKKRLRIGEFDFAILMDMGDFSGFEKRLIYEGNFSLYVSRKIKKKEEKDLNFILTESDDVFAFREAYFQKYQQEPIISIQARSWVVGAHLVAQQLGIGYFPDYIAQNNNLNLRQCDRGLKLPKYKLYAIYLKNMKLRKSSQIFLSYFAS